MKKVYIICPVRNLNTDERTVLEEYVHKLEAQGIRVHFPPRDTNQNDLTGWNIVLQNRKAVEECDEVHVFWNKNSQGSLFDLGMALALKKPVKLVNAIEPTHGKSFENVLLEWEKKQDFSTNDEKMHATIAEYIKALSRTKKKDWNKAAALSKTVANFIHSQEFQTWAARNQEDPLVSKLATAYSKFVQRIMQTLFL